MYGILSDRMMADDLTMAYDGNRLSSLTDNAGEVLSEALPDIPSGAYSGNDFRYDAAGCVTRDMARGITHMAYHRPGIPAKKEANITINPTCHYIRKFQRCCILFPIK